MSWKTALLLTAFAVGCGKKKEPETAAGPMIEAGIGMVDVNVKPNPEGMDERWINAPVTIKNNLAGPITVNKIEWNIGVGAQDLGNNSQEFNEQIAAGASGTFTLTNKFVWKDETPLSDDMADVKGTVTWTGPKGNQQTTPIELKGEIKKEPTTNINDKDGAGQ